MRHLPPILITILITLSTSCSLFSHKQKIEKKTEKKTTTTQTLVGRIGSISADQSFVLIEMYQPAIFTNGTIITTQNPNHLANLRITGEKRERYIAADIQSGSPALNDPVFYSPSATDPKPDPKPPEKKPTPKPQTHTQ